MHANSVTVNFDFFLGGDALVDEEFENVTSVIALKLNDVTPLAVLCCVSIAAPGLLKVARQLSHVQVLRQSSNRGQTLTSISFLKVQMHKIVSCYLASLSLSTTLGRCSVERIVIVEDEHIIVFLIFVRKTILACCSSSLLVFTCHILTN